MNFHTRHQKGGRGVRRHCPTSGMKTAVVTPGVSERAVHHDTTTHRLAPDPEEIGTCCVYLTEFTCLS